MDVRSFQFGDHCHYLPLWSTALFDDIFPKSAAYDLDWLADGLYGANPLWLTEWLCADLDLQPGMNVLDLGCGKCRSSVFLAKEFDLNVVAVDLWNSATDNEHVVRDAGLTNPFEGGIPKHLLKFWQPDAWSIQTSQWWRHHWERTGLVEIDAADTMNDGWKVWLAWAETNGASDWYIETLKNDAGRFLGYVRTIGSRIPGKPLLPKRQITV